MIEDTKSKRYAYSTFISALYELKKTKTAGKYNKYIKKIIALEEKVSHDKSDIDKHNKLVNKCAKKLSNLLYELEKKQGFYVLSEPAKKARNSEYRLKSDYDYIGAEKYTSDLSLINAICSDFRNIHTHKKEIKKGKKQINNGIMREEEQNTIISPASAAIGITNIVQINNLYEQKRQLDKMYGMGKDIKLDFRNRSSIDTDLQELHSQLAEHEIVAIINRYYDRRYEKKLSKNNLKDFEINVLFKLAKDLAEDIYKKTLVNASYNSSEDNKKLKEVFSIYSLDDRMEKFIKYRENFDSELSKLEPSKRQEIQTIMEKYTQNRNIVPTKQGIINYVSQREQEFLLNYGIDELRATAFNISIQKYNLNIVATHIPVEELPKIYKKVKMEINERYKAYAALANLTPEKLEENRISILTVAQEEYSRMILNKVMKIDASQSDIIVQLEAEICRRYFEEEPLFANRVKDKNLVTATNTQKVYDEMLEEWSKISTFDKAKNKIFGLKPKTSKTK